ncbi:MAG: hypothetical protein HOO92_05745 [Methylococcaceae bacterium]|nr:hypothetical protein [Methylococcaceae bacterium]
MMRDLMAPETEPTDEELELVMEEALAQAMLRKSQSDAWIKQHLHESVAEVNAQQCAAIQ